MINNIFAKWKAKKRKSYVDIDDNSQEIVQGLRISSEC